MQKGVIYKGEDMFTFVVIIYNEKDTVLYLLESIKYQIENYGELRRFQLILADDASKDNSCVVIDKWLEKNACLFAQIDKQYSIKNRGTCRSLAEAFRKIKGNLFYLVAGDDIIARGNMFKKYELLDKYDIVANGILVFGNNYIDRNRKKYLNVALQGVYTPKYLKNAIKFGCPILNGAIIRKELLTEEVLKFMEQYVLLDDRPRYYQIFSEHNDIKYYYSSAPILLYRESENSVSNFKSVYKSVLDKDIENLYRKIKEDSSSIFERVKLSLQQSSLKYRGKGGINKILRYLTPYYIGLMMLMTIRKIKITQFENELIKDYADENDKHILDMIKRTQINGEDKYEDR